MTDAYAARAQEHMRSIEAALAVNDIPRAADLAEAAVRDGIRHPLLHNLIAHRLEEQGRLDDSIAELRRGLELTPDDVQLLTTLGFSLIQKEARSEALEVFDRTVAKYPNFAPAHFGRGSALERLGELLGAGGAYQRAVTLAPDYADAWSGLGDLAERRGEHDEARAMAARALAIAPRHLDARITLARLANATKNYSGAEATLRDVLADPRLTPIASANARILLADALDGQRRIDEAWASYTDGNNALRDLCRPVFEGGNLSSPAAAATRLAGEFTETEPSDWIGKTDATARGDAKSHAFLFGFARSGTTLLEQILATHPDVVALEERPTLHDTEMDFVTLRGGLQQLAKFDDVALRPYREGYWRRVRGFGVEPGGKAFLDKFPLNTFKIPLIVKLFPEAKLLFALRDPRDVVLSCFRRTFRMNTSMYQFTDLMAAARYYDAVMTSAVLYRERLPLDLYEVRYEALVDDFEGEARRICSFLGLDWIDELKDFAATSKRRGVATPSGVQVSRGLYRDGMQQWRRYARQLEAARDILAPWVKYYGYPAD